MRLRKLPLSEQCISQSNFCECHAVLVTNLLISMEGLLKSLEGPANVPEIKRNLAEIIEFTCNAVFIPYVLMDRERFPVAFARREVISLKGQSDGFNGLGIRDSPLVVSCRIEISGFVNDFVHCVQATEVFEQPRLGDHSFGHQQG